MDLTRRSLLASLFAVLLAKLWVGKSASIKLVVTEIDYETRTITLNAA